MSQTVKICQAPPAVVRSKQSSEVRKPENPSGFYVPVTEREHNHAPGVVCRACRELEVVAVQDTFAELSFVQAFPIWLKAHEPPVIQKSTYAYYAAYGTVLSAFYGAMKLKDIGLGEVRAFQRWRCSEFTSDDLPFDSPLYQSKFRHAAGSVRIRSEINCVLKPMLREAGRWEDIRQKKFRHLPIPREGSGVALTKEEQGQILAIAFSKKKWLLKAHCLRIQYRTGASFGELKKLRRKDVDFKEGTITIIEGAKNSGPRTRRVALVPTALESMRWIVARWEKLGGKNPEDYLLPHRAHIKEKRFDRWMGSTYRTWRAIKKAWLEKHPEAKNKEIVRDYDCRPSAASVLLKNPNLSLSTIEKALGWTPNSQMRKRYNRVELDDQREALNTLEAS